MSSKAASLFGDFNLNALDYDTNEVFKMDFYPLSKDLR